MTQCVNLDLFAPESARVESPTNQAGRCGASTATRVDQLDLFRDSAIEQAAARARRALQQTSIASVRTELAFIRAQCPDLEGFACDMECCIEAIERGHPRWQDTGAALDWIESALRPAAARALADHPDRVVHLALRSLLAQADDRPYQAATAHTHHSYLYHLLGEYEQAMAAVERDSAWRSNEAALCWHAELARAGSDHKAEFADIAELCFAFPESAEIAICASPSLAAHWDEFCDAEPAMPIHAFPAWCRLLHAVPLVCARDADPRPGGSLLGIATALATTAGADLAVRKSMQLLAPQLLSTWLRRGAS